MKQTKNTVANARRMAAELERQMVQAAEKLDFEEAAALRDELVQLKALIDRPAAVTAVTAARSVPPAKRRTINKPNARVLADLHERLFWFIATQKR